MIGLEEARLMGSKLIEFRLEQLLLLVGDRLLIEN